MGFTGCASIVSGHNQPLSVTTQGQGGADVAGAKCTLSNDKGTWYVTTPGSVTVHRSFNDLSVNCAHDAFDPGVTTVKSATKGMAFGNILFGGIIGAGVDMSSGAAYDYPSLIPVGMGAPNANGSTAKKPVDPPAVSPAAAARALGRGDQLVYKVTDKFTGVSREVTYRVDRIDGDKVVFNQGGRVERKDGTIVSMSTPVGGDMDVYAPPGGWGRANLKFGTSWSNQYSIPVGSGYGGDYDLQAMVLSESTSVTPLGETKLVHIQYEGTARRTEVATTPVSIRVDLQVWYSPEWGRVVRFESNLNPYASNSAARSREFAELVALQRF
jgi:hypothetical protein